MAVLYTLMKQNILLLHLPGSPYCSIYTKHNVHLFGLLGSLYCAKYILKTTFISLGFLDLLTVYSIHWTQHSSLWASWISLLCTVYTEHDIHLRASGFSLLCTVYTEHLLGSPYCSIYMKHNIHVFGLTGSPYSSICVDVSDSFKSHCDNALLLLIHVGKYDMVMVQLYNSHYTPPILKHMCHTH